MLHVFEIDKSNFSTSQNDKHSGYFDNLIPFNSMMLQCVIIHGLFGTQRL